MGEVQKGRWPWAWFLTAMGLTVLGGFFGRFLRSVSPSELAPAKLTAQNASPPRFNTTLPEPTNPQGRVSPVPSQIAGRITFSGVREAAKLHARDPYEWQGMLVDLTTRQVCDISSRCGLAMACRDGRCGPCARDADCADGEGCVLDHCLLRDAIECRSTKECTEAICMLTEYAAYGRGNATMQAKCFSLVGGRQRQAETSATRGQALKRPPPVSPGILVATADSSSAPVT